MLGEGWDDMRAAVGCSVCSSSADCVVHHILQEAYMGLVSVVVGTMYIVYRIHANFHAREFFVILANESRIEKFTTHEKLNVC